MESMFASAPVYPNIATDTMAIETQASRVSTAGIAEIERYIQGTAPGPTTGPTAPQSVGAQLHHQPTPGSVEGAEGKARADGLAALDRARKADAAGDAAACKSALEEAKLIYGLE